MKAKQNTRRYNVVMWNMEDGIEDLNRDIEEAFAPAGIASEKIEGDLLDDLSIDDMIGLYFRDVRPIPLLSREAEIELARQIQDGEKARHRLTITTQDLPPEETTHLYRQVQAGKQALLHLGETNFRLVI